MNLAHFQDALGQLPGLKTYTHIILCFPLRNGLSPALVVTLLETAVQTLLSAFPWLAYKVVHEDSGPGNSGTFRLLPCPEFAAPNTIVRTKDCTDICPKYKEILDAHGPVSVLDGTVLGAVPAFPQIYNDAELNPAPVFTLQANFVHEGMLLDVAAQHNFIDGGGLLRLLELLAKSLRGETFSVAEIKHVNRDRSNLIPLLQPHEPMLEHGHLIRDSLSAAPLSRQQPGAHWGFIRFPAAKVTLLKQQANRDIEDMHDAFVSTDDALSAFIWKYITIVRLKRRQRPCEISKFSRALDARRALQIPREYLGQMGYNATCYLTFLQLQDLSLGEIALYMREAVEKVNTEYSVRSWATFVAKEPDKSKIMFGGTFIPDNDIGLSSLIHASVNSIKFGILGEPDLVRRPNFLPLESCVYLWTRTVEGHVDALLCLKPDDWAGLQTDAQWSAYTKFIG